VFATRVHDGRQHSYSGICFVLLWLYIVPFLGGYITRKGTIHQAYCLLKIVVQITFTPRGLLRNATIPAGSVMLFDKVNIKQGHIEFKLHLMLCKDLFKVNEIREIRTRMSL
jgi:hypothetical protein